MNFFELTKDNFNKYKSIMKEQIIDTYRISFVDQVFPDDFFDKRIDALYSYICDAKAICIVCEDITLVGHIWCHEGVEFGTLKWYIDNFYLNPKYRNFGIGTELLNRSLDIARERDIHICELMVSANNSGALNFYKNKGFDITRHKMEMFF